MIDGLEVRPNDRILSLSIPDPETIRVISGRLERGGVVCLGGRDEVCAARRRLRDLPNVLFHPGPPEEIPFDDEYFTLVVDLHCAWTDPERVSREIQRVLLGGGRAVVAGASSRQLLAAGLEEGESAGEFRVLHKPEGARPPTPGARQRLTRPVAAAPVIRAAEDQTRSPAASARRNPP